MRSDRRLRRRRRRLSLHAGRLLDLGRHRRAHLVPAEDDIARPVQAGIGAGTGAAEAVGDGGGLGRLGLGLSRARAGGLAEKGGRGGKGPGGRGRGEDCAASEEEQGLRGHG